jgi:hypothetical protein
VTAAGIIALARSAGTRERCQHLQALEDAIKWRRARLAAGDCGTVEFTDSLGTVHVRWDSGRRVGIIATERDLIRGTPAAC